MKKVKFWIFFVVLLMTLNSCQTINEGMVGSKRSKSGDEFLVYKKKPLVVPPDFEELPIPKANKNNSNYDENSEKNLKQILDINDETNSSSSDIPKKTSDIEKSILEKIN